MKIQNYLWECERFNRKCFLRRRFPNERLGVADRSIFNLIIRKQAYIFREHEEDHTVPHNTRALNLAIMSEMKEFGFTPILPELEGHGLEKYRTI